MATEYVNTSPAALLGAFPRAVYRATVARAGLLRLGIGSWPETARETLERAGASPYGIALSSPTPGGSDGVAILEFRAPSNPASGDSVGDLAAAIDTATAGARLVRLERFPPVPARGSPEEAARQQSRETQLAEAEKEAARDSLGARISRTLQASRATLAIGAAAGIVVLALIYLPRPRRTGGAESEGGDLWT